MEGYVTYVEQDLPPGLRFRNTGLDVEDGREFHFSPREMQTLYLILCGNRRKQVAAKLGVSLQTVDLYKNALFNKVRVRNAACLIRYAVQSGWMSVDQIMVKGIKIGRASCRERVCQYV